MLFIRIHILFLSYVFIYKADFYNVQHVVCVNHSFFFDNYFILVSVMADLLLILGKLGVQLEYTMNAMLVHHRS